MPEHPITELTAERFNRARPGPGVAVSAAASAFVREAKVHSVAFLDCLSIVGLAAPVTGQYTREGEVPGGAPWMSSTSHPPLALDLLAAQPEHFNVFGDYVNAVADWFIGLAFMVDDLPFVETVGQHVPDAGACEGSAVASAESPGAEPIRDIPVGKPPCRVVL